MTNDTKKTFDPYHTRQSLPLHQGGNRVVADTKGICVVYYVQMSCGHIKIGTSSDFIDRLRHLNVGGISGKKAVLALEFGSFVLEKQRHKQFADDRYGKTEHFNPSDQLLEHIDQLKKLINVS